jgi:hypothetical protein
VAALRAAEGSRFHQNGPCRASDISHRVKRWEIVLAIPEGCFSQLPIARVAGTPSPAYSGASRSVEGSLVLRVSTKGAQASFAARIGPEAMPDQHTFSCRYSMLLASSGVMSVSS